MFFLLVVFLLTFIFFIFYGNSDIKKYRKTRKTLFVILFFELLLFLGAFISSFCFNVLSWME